MRQRIQLNAEHVDLWAAETALGKLATGPTVERWVREEYERLSAAAAGSGKSSLLTDGEVQNLRQRARVNVLARLQREGVTVAEEDPLDRMIAETVAEFSSEVAPIDGRSNVEAHLRATVVAAAASADGRVTERAYWKALEAVGGIAGETARREADDDSAALHCQSAEALSDLAHETLRQRGIRPSSPEFEQMYVAEIEQLGRRYSFPYGRS
jgi:hypothetical protein